MMKKLLALSVFFTLAFGAYAQQLHVKPSAITGKHVNLNARYGNNQTMGTIDTLYPPNMTGMGCDTNLALYYFDVNAAIDTGYVFGTNTQPITVGGVTYTVVLTESAQKYNVTGSANITGILFGAGNAHSDNGTAVVVGKIYSMDNTTKGPSGTTLGTSSNLALNTVTTSALNLLNFGTPVAVSNQNFFASVVAPVTFGGANHDTLGILSTVFGCSSTDSLAWSREVATAPGGTQVLNKWYSVRKLLGQSGATFSDVDLWQFPIINITTATSSVTKGGLSLYAASPNPATNSIDINFSLNTASKVEIEMYDMTGKLVKSVKNANTFANGKHAVNVDISNLESGSYMYSINAGGNKMFSKFVVTK